MKIAIVTFLVLSSIFWIVTAFSRESNLEFIILFTQGAVNIIVALLVPNLEDNE